MGGSEARGQGAHRQRVVSEKGWGRHVACSDRQSAEFAALPKTEYFVIWRQPGM
jgi:hypothetical protein